MSVQVPGGGVPDDRVHVGDHESLHTCLSFFMVLFCLLGFVAWAPNGATGFVSVGTSGEHCFGEVSVFNGNLAGPFRC